MKSPRDLLRHLTAPRTLSVLLWVMGLVDLASALVPRLRPRLEVINDWGYVFAAHVAGVGTAIAGILLIVLARGVRRGLRSAWWASVLLLGATSVLHMIKDFDLAQALLSLALLALFLTGRAQFAAKDSPRSAVTTVGVAVGAFVTAVLLGTVLQTLFHHGQAVGTTLWHRVLNSVTGMVGLNDRVQYLSDAVAARWQVSLLMIGAAALLTVLVVALRPSDGPHPLRPEEETELRALMARNKRPGSLGYFALRRDRSVIFSPSRTSAISFKVVGGVSLAGGDPIGDPGLFGEAIEAWLTQTREFGWLPGVLGASEAGARAYQKAGLEVLELGDEAVLDVTTFSLSGRAMKGVRNTVTKTRREGLTVDIRRVGDLSADDVAAVRTAADAWRDGPVERGFSMALGRFADPADRDCVLARAFVDGHLCGVLHMVPWGITGLSLDLMRRKPDAVNGTVETMVTELVEWCRGQGMTRISLNFAVFREAFERGDRLGAGPMQKLQYRTLMFISRFAQLASLYRSNAKYEPDWQPRYVCYERAGDLVEVAIAMLRAEAFLTPPSFGRRGAPKGDEPAALTPAEASDVVHQ
ncbi:phosphatidylglycerol lysyltransferase domain-containing protein [Propionibacteriaceae bacterium G1746]